MLPLKLIPARIGPGDQPAERSWVIEPAGRFGRRRHADECGVKFGHPRPGWYNYFIGPARCHGKLQRVNGAKPCGDTRWAFAPDFRLLQPGGGGARPFLTEGDFAVRFTHFLEDGVLARPARRTFHCADATAPGSGCGVLSRGASICLHRLPRRPSGMSVTPRALAVKPDRLPPPSWLYSVQDAGHIGFRLRNMRIAAGPINTLIRFAGELADRIRVCWRRRVFGLACVSESPLILLSKRRECSILGPDPTWPVIDQANC